MAPRGSKKAGAPKKPSAPKEDVGALPPARNRKRAADTLTNDQQQQDSEDEREPKKRKAEGGNGIDTSLPPIDDPRGMFLDMVKRLKPVLLKKSPTKLNVATICSGTDAPIFALKLIQDALRAAQLGPGFEFDHLFSCEIEPFKQGFIRRNLPPGTLIFRDVVELALTALTGKATTAGGSKAAIPAQKLDILFAGCSCVDYSNMNVKVKDIEKSRTRSLDRHLKGHEKDYVAPVELDEAFVRDLDSGLDELLRLGKGESARTFFAAVKLITIIRPKLIMLENVYGAPWTMYQNLIFPKICYVARKVSLDSKDFYLPQTRQRGYLVAVDAFKLGEEQAMKIVCEWIDQLAKCQRSPSVSVTSFLRPADDPATIQARADMERKSPQNSDWAMSSLRHINARQSYSIRRDDNPFSKKAMRNNRLIFAIYPSHSWLRFWEAQVARVVDLFDITFAITNKQGADLSYKTAMIDVSQNVDRNSFVDSKRSCSKKSLGIVGCITPSGMPIVTDMMRPITGTEALALQGLSVDELVISTETQAQLRDLAGNAMTVTVVGGVTLALLLAIHKTGMAASLFEPLESAQSRCGLHLVPPQGESLVVAQASATTTEVDSLLAIAREMVRVCYCSVRPDGVFVCDTCGNTACQDCRGNPEHSFGAHKVAVPKLSAGEGKVCLTRLLPKSLRLPIPHYVANHASSLIRDGLYRSVVSDILTTDPVYYFDDIKVTEVVTVCYQATNSIARLVLSPDSASSWYIYVAPWHRHRPALARTFDLDQPVARRQPSARSPSVPEWSVWAPGHIGLTLEMTKTGSGAVVARNLSFAARYDAASDASLLEWKTSVEEKVRGTYLHRPECGTAGNALHVKQTSAGAAKVFMMWDSARLGDPADDHFVWTETVRRMEPHEYHEILLHAEPTLSWNLDSDLGTVSASWPGYWSFPYSYSRDHELIRPVPVQDIVQLHWGLTNTVQQASCHQAGQSAITCMPVLATITATLRGFPNLVSRFPEIDARQTNDSFYLIPATGCDAFLRMLAFLSSELRKSRRPHDLALVAHLNGKWVTVARCSDCSVTPPDVTIIKADDDKHRTIEDPDEAARFERQYQDLPRTVAVAARLRQPEDNAGLSTVDMRIMLQPMTLASRAFAYLVQAHRTISRGRSALHLGARTSFTVVLDYAPSSVQGFAPFRDSVRSCDPDSTAGIDVNHEYQVPSSAPPRFDTTTAKNKRGQVTKMAHKLRPSQKEAVDWMLQRERAPMDFVESEIEEEVVAPLNMRVLGKAEWVNRFPYSSRGGVVAHEIGYGKTVVSLALIDYMQEFDQNRSIAEREEKVDGAWVQELPQPFGQFAGVDQTYTGLRAETFFCHLSATLVIVPRHITNQWNAEAGKFLGLGGRKVLMIKTTQAFYGNCSLANLQEAEIIIVSSAVFGGTFLQPLQTIAGVAPDSATGGLGKRSREAWYRRALRRVRILTAYYFAGRAAGISDEELVATIRQGLLPDLIANDQAEVDALIDKQVPHSDRQMYKKAARKAGRKGAKTAAADAEADAGGSSENQQSDGTDNKDPKPKAAKAAKAGKAAADKNAWKISWLHNCSFARIIWDECSYDEELIHLFVSNAVANAKWLLSGTPKLFGLAQVCKIAAAFGVHVARPEPRMMPGLPPVTDGPQLAAMSASEEFHVYSSRVKSAALAHERHSQAQTFVSWYFRANALDNEVDIEFEEHILPINMSAVDLVRYHLVNQEILDADNDYTALPAHARDAVALAINDLDGRDGFANAKMLLGLLACGLGRGGVSIKALQEDRARRGDELSDQMKLLWDKTMWLWRWIKELELKKQEKFTPGDPVPQISALVEGLCKRFEMAFSLNQGLEWFGGRELFHQQAAIVAGV